MREREELRIFRGDNHKVKNIYLGNGLDALAIIAHLYPSSLNVVAMDITHLPPTPQPTNDQELSDKRFYAADVLQISFLRLRNALATESILYIHAYKEDAIRIKELVNIFDEEFYLSELLSTRKDIKGEKCLLMLFKGITSSESEQYLQQARQDIKDAKGDGDTLFRRIQQSTKTTSLFMTAYDINRFHADMLTLLLVPRQKTELELLATADEQVVEHIQRACHQLGSGSSNVLADTGTTMGSSDVQTFINAAVDSAKQYHVPYYIPRELTREEGLLFNFYQELSAANILFLELNA